MSDFVVALIIFFCVFLLLLSSSSSSSFSFLLLPYHPGTHTHIYNPIFLPPRSAQLSLTTTLHSFLSQTISSFLCLPLFLTLSIFLYLSPFPLSLSLSHTQNTHKRTLSLIFHSFNILGNQRSQRNKCDAHREGSNGHS